MSSSAKIEVTPTLGPWKSTNAVKASNFGGVAARVTAMVPDPAKPGEMTSVTIAKVFGGLHDDRDLAQVNARAVAALPDLVKALEDLNGAMRFVLAFYEPGQRHLDTNAWKQAEAGARAAHERATAALSSCPVGREELKVG